MQLRYAPRNILLKMQEHRTQASNRLAAWKLLAAQLQRLRDRQSGAPRGPGIEAAAKCAEAPRHQEAICGAEAAAGEDAAGAKGCGRGGLILTTLLCN